MPEHAADPVDHSWFLPLDDHPAMADVRRWVRQGLRGVVTEAMLEDIVLVVVELVTNAEVHTDSPVCLAMSYWHDTVRIEVTDGDPSLPVLQPRSTTRLGGRGIYLVDAMSADWGVRPHRQGKSVWSLFGRVDPKR